MNHPFGQRKRNIIRHPLNSRQQSSVRLAYVASCKARGVVEGVRGEAWLMQPSPSDSIQEKTPYLALSYGSLSEAFYQACCDSPDNDNLMVSVKKGLEARILSQGTPPVVVRLLINMSTNRR